MSDDRFKEARDFVSHIYGGIFQQTLSGSQVEEVALRLVNTLPAAKKDEPAALTEGERT